MKKNKKIITMLSAVLLLTAPTTAAATGNQAHAAQTDQQANEKQGKLTLNHNTRIYNKKGQKLWSYRGGSSLLKKNTAVTYASTVQPISDPSTKRFSYHDDNWDWYYLPYKMIKGQEYYSIGHGGYVKAANVEQINGCYLYASYLKLPRLPKEYSEVQILDKDGKTTGRKVTLGRPLTLDRSTDNGGLNGRYADDDGDTSYFRIKGTDNFVGLDTADVVQGRQLLLPYSNYMNVVFTNAVDLYTSKGEKVVRTTNTGNQGIILGNQSQTKVDAPTTAQIGKGRIEIVSKEIYLWVPEEHKAELFYQLQADDLSHEFKTDLFVKATEAKYAYGPQLMPSNTAEDVQAPTVPNK
ncbi:SLAP domain-containing protein [Lactobacillus sp. ESL0791]|uniref:SLAP domain-containing protein n=1 Tax=Lactobacillus sp. ESL0791 TaxID=2983234 RepID=UPI0023F88312|nr:SLAP domain-containing protein [Lactobacillus sp. ESL0791]MDF7638440.1 SLAP domain-containing protein [Lactobacillus sp. ESL0791]